MELNSSVLYYNAHNAIVILTPIVKTMIMHDGAMLMHGPINPRDCNNI